MRQKPQATLEELLQERIDEILLLEDRLERRGKAFAEETLAAQIKSQMLVDTLIKEVKTFKQTLLSIHTTSGLIQESVKVIKTQASKTSQLFLGTVLGCTLIILGTLWWSHYMLG